jgi:FHA domain
MKAELVPEDGSAPIPIKRDVTVVGRREYCDVQIDHPSLSKRHAVLVMTDGLLILRDLASTNGTKVKGQRIRWAALLPDDRVTFGSQKFRVYLGPDDALSPSERPRGSKEGRSRPLSFPAPSPLGVPVVAGARTAPKNEDLTGSDDWRNAMAKRPNGKPAAAHLNDDDLLIEDEIADAILDDDDDEIVDLP